MENLVASIYANPILLIVVLAWTLAWKGMALWKAAGKKSKIWFVVLLVVNTVGLLEILYYFIFSNISKRKSAPEIEKMGE